MWVFNCMSCCISFTLKRRTGSGALEPSVVGRGRSLRHWKGCTRVGLALGQAWLILPEERNAGKMFLFSQKGEVRSFVRRGDWGLCGGERERERDCRSCQCSRLDRHEIPKANYCHVHT